MNYYINLFLKGIKNKKIFISILIILFTMGIALEFGSEYLFHDNYILVFLEGYNGDKTLLPAIFPLIATIPFAAHHIEQRKSGSMKYVVSRMGFKKYFNSIFIANAMLTFFTFMVGMSIFLLILLPFFSKDINMNRYLSILKISPYEIFGKISPLLYAIVIIVHCSFVAVAFSSLGLAVSYFIKNKFIAWVSPFLISTVASLFALFIGLTKLEPMAIFDIGRITGTNFGLIFWYLFIMIVGSYIMSYFKFKRDIEADEEI